MGEREELQWAKSGEQGGWKTRVHVVLVKNSLVKKEM
jgi:hypothetical protein